MAKKRANRKHKDSLFRVIFGEHKEHALSLYNAINKTNYTDVDELKIITLEDALYIDIKNDVGFIFHDVMNLIEHQSTYNPNMPLRGLGYFSDSYKEYVSEVYGDAAAVYLSKMIEIPTPKFYVLYNGLEDAQDEDLRLSNAYKGEGDIEVVAHMININFGHNETLLEACKPLKGYSDLVHRIRTFKEEGYSDEEAVSTAVDSCIKDGILTDILKKERDKVENILIRGLTEEEKKKLERMELEYRLEKAETEGLERGMAKGLEKGMAEGLEKGMTEGRFKDVQILVSKGILDEDQACEALGVSKEDYMAFISEKQN